MVDRALRAGGEIIADEARRLVPIDSGELRESIQVGGDGLNSSRQEVRQGRAVISVGPRQGPGYPDGFYAHMVEFGTVKMAAEPFMRPAVDNTRDEVDEAIADVLAGEIVKQARG